MRTLLIGFVVCPLFVVFPGARALAQGSPPAAQAQAAPEPEPFAEGPRDYRRSYGHGYRPYDQYDLERAEERSRIVRNALIGTSAALAAGIILAGIGSSQCDHDTQSDGSDDWTCNTAGNVLWGIGGTFIGLGTIGALTTGIMLGVRNKQKREIEWDMRRRYRSRVRWDEGSGQFVF